MHAGDAPRPPCSQSAHRRAQALQAIPHLICYSHADVFYTLPETASFDALGLWSFRGMLLATAEHFVRESASGFLVKELDALMGVATTDVSRKLTRQTRLTGVRLGTRSLYLAPEAAPAR